MKSVLSILFLGSFSALGQNSGFPNCAVKLKRMTYTQLERAVALDKQREYIELLERQLDSAKQKRELIKEDVRSLQSENEVLRQQMQEYIKQIDELNQKNSGVPNELKKEED